MHSFFLVSKFGGENFGLVWKTGFDLSNGPVENEIMVI